MQQARQALDRARRVRRTTVLRKLGHVSGEGVVALKGLAASEISTGDELLSTELMFNGVFGGLNRHQLVALVSVLVPTEKSNVRDPTSSSICHLNMHACMQPLACDDAGISKSYIEGAVPMAFCSRKPVMCAACLEGQGCRALLLLHILVSTLGGPSTCAGGE